MRGYCVMCIREFEIHTHTGMLSYATDTYDVHEINERRKNTQKKKTKYIV